MSTEDTRPSAIATPEDLAEAREVTLLQEHLRTVIIPEIERARIAEIAGEVWDFAGYAGVDVPPPYKKLIGSIAYFGPLLKLFPGYAKLPEWFRDGFDHVLEGAELARRTFD